jgi:hypothetical protein
VDPGSAFLHRKGWVARAAAFENERPRGLLHIHQPCWFATNCTGACCPSLSPYLCHRTGRLQHCALAPHGRIHQGHTQCVCSSSDMLRRCIVWGTQFSADHFQPLPWRRVRAFIGSRPPFCAHHGASIVLVARLDVGAHSKLHYHKLYQASVGPLCESATAHRNAIAG